MKRFLHLTAALISALLIMSCGGNYGPMGGWDHMMNYGYGSGGMFMWLLLIIVIGVVVYIVIQNTKAKTSGGPLQETPLDILKRRYAKGKITKGEYDRLKRDLEL
jgi:putative membrane protein